MPGLAYNPLFICGPPGLGKTHLLHSIANYVTAYGGGATVRYTTAEAFTNHFLGALHGHDIESFKAAYRGVDVLLVDDVQFLQAKARTEQEFFHTFNALHQAGAQIVLTSDRLPRDLGELEERLRERFEAGLVTDVRAPDPSTRLAILRKRVQQDQVGDLDPAALELIADRVTDNVRALEGALIRVVAFGSLTGRPVTAELTAEVLDGLYPDRKTRAGAMTVREIQERTAEAFGVSVEALVSTSRVGDRRVAAPGRHVPRARADRPDAAGHRPRLRRPQPHDRAARLQAHGRADRRRPRRVRDGPPAHRVPARPERGVMTPLGLTDFPRRVHTRRTASNPAACGLLRQLCTPSTPLMTVTSIEVVVRIECEAGNEMRLSTQRDALFAQLQTVTRAASTRSAVQALSGVQLLASDAGIELRATDMEIGLRVPLDGEVVREGAVVLPARLLVDVVRSLPGDSVTLELRAAEQDVEIVAGAATFHIRTLRLEDFPPFPEPDGDGRVQVPGAGVRRDDRQGRPLGVARRDAPGADRHPRVGERRRAADGGDRLLPPLGQGDEARGAARRERSRPTCRRARCRS